DKLVYTYYYRNEYFLADRSLQLNSRGNTIDTVSTAQIEIANVESHNKHTLAKPPLIVNKNTATYGKYLFVHAALMGKFEPKEKLDTSSIIDVYDIVGKSYRFSFHIPNRSNSKMSDFMVYGNLVIVLSGRDLSVYRITIND